MLPGHSPVVQALLGTLFTWGLTAAGSAVVFIFSGRQVMLAASYWSLLAPAVDMAEESGKYGPFAFLPVAVGFALGAAFVYFADLMMPFLGVGADPHLPMAHVHDGRLKEKMEDPARPAVEAQELSIRIENGEVYQRRKGVHTSHIEGPEAEFRPQEASTPSQSSWRRIVLLILAITIHNVPEGLAVGVGFGAAGKTSSATFESARNLAIGIGIQNFPEGLAVSLPLCGSGMSTWRAFWYGQLSGMVEPLAGLLGGVAVVLAEPLLPYALAFAAGAMVYVVVDDIVPEAQVSGNGKLASWTCIFGFIIMMSLDVGLG
uniref:Zinc transporter ZIP11 n=1 Tax=Electrophorus electricus TaxID=8005 RepID=A0A4W4E151_ELEEL